MSAAAGSPGGTRPKEPGDGHYLLAYAVLAVAFTAEGVSFARAARQLRREAAHAGRSVFSYLAATDDPTVLTATEDGAALVGLVLAGGGIVLAQLTGLQAWQAVACFATGAVLVAVAVGLGRANMELLIGESAGPRPAQPLRAALLGHEEIDDVLELRTMRIGTGRLLVAAYSSTDLECTSTRIDEQLRARFPVVDQLFLDPTPPVQS